jgi:hypothetical protein
MREWWTRFCMVRKGSPVRVRQRASEISRAFFSHAARAPSREVPNGYILAALDGHAVGPWAGTEGGQFSRSVLFFYVSTSTREAAFLRPSEAAELAGLSTRAIYRAIERGELRAAKCSALLSKLFELDSSSPQPGEGQCRAGSEGRNARSCDGAYWAYSLGSA